MPGRNKIQLVLLWSSGLNDAKIGRFTTKIAAEHNEIESDDDTNEDCVWDDNDDVISSGLTSEGLVAIDEETKKHEQRCRQTGCNTNVTEILGVVGVPFTRWENS
jgi:hypothetical protein